MMVKKYSWGVIGVVERNGRCHHISLGGFRKYSAYLLVVVVFGGSMLFLDALLLAFLPKKKRRAVSYDAKKVFLVGHWSCRA